MNNMQQICAIVVAASAGFDTPKSESIISIYIERNISSIYFDIYRRKFGEIGIII